jgi:predicted MFS family arabinose efflux permease
LGAAASGLLLERIGATATVGVFSAWYLLLAVLTTFNQQVRRARPLDQIAARQAATQGED